MNIAVDIRSTLKNRTGIGNYTFGLVNALAGIDSENTYFLYSYIRLFDRKRKLWPLPGNNFRHRVDRLSFSPERAFRDVDVLHTSSYDMPASRTYGLFTTVHDLVPLIFPKGYSDEYLMRLEKDLKRVFAESKVIIADSMNTRQDIERMFPGMARRVEVVYPGRDEGFKVLEKQHSFNMIKERYGIFERYLLYSGGMDPRKNVRCLVDAFHMLRKTHKIPQKLVIIGTKGKWAGEVSKRIAKLGLEKEIVFTGYVPACDLNFFYSAADCFVYPSLYEGFGFPILEAFSSGVPVVTSATSSCGELASDAAITVDPGQTGELAEAVRKILEDKELASALAARGRERADDFSWKVSAAHMLDIFRGN
jgi:glycosyltransferase involved in cell wall biosynthesis